MSIYENPEEYAKVCKCSLEIAIKRCNHYLQKLKLANNVICPECGCSSNEFVFDDDGSDYPSEAFISCTGCWSTFDTNDERIKDWVSNEKEFDEILFTARNTIDWNELEKWLGMKWNDFVSKQTLEIESKVT